MPITRYAFTVPIVVATLSAAVSVANADDQIRTFEVSGGTTADLVAVMSSTDGGSTWTTEVCRMRGNNQSLTIKDNGTSYKIKRIEGTTALVMEMMAADVLLSPTTSVQRYAFTVPASGEEAAVDVSAAHPEGRQFLMGGGTLADVVAVQSSQDGGTSWNEIARVAGGNSTPNSAPVITHAGVRYRLRRITGSGTGLTFAMLAVSLRTGQIGNGGNAGAVTVGSTNSTTTIIGNNTAFLVDDGTNTILGRLTASSQTTINCGAGGTISIGSSNLARTVQLGTGGAQQDVTIGSGTGASSLNLKAGTGAINIGTDNAARSINIGTATAAQTVIVGSTDSTSSLKLDAGTGAIDIGTSAAARTINVGTGAAAQTINVGTGAAAATITMGNTTGATKVRANVGTGGFGVNCDPHASAILQLDSTTRGFAMPRMDTTARDAITAGAIPLLVYNTSTDKLNFRTVAGAWEAITSA